MKNPDFGCSRRNGSLFLRMKAHEGRDLLRAIESAATLAKFEESDSRLPILAEFIACLEQGLVSNPEFDWMNTRPNKDNRPKDKGGSGLLDDLFGKQSEEP